MLRMDPGSSGRRVNALTTEPSLQPEHSVSISVPRASNDRARVCRRSPKPNAHTRPCLSTPLEASKTPASADSLPNDDWMVAGFSPHSEAHHTHPTMGLCHWGPLLPWEVCHIPGGHKRRCNDTTVRDIWFNGKSASPQKPTLSTWATLVG